MRDQMETALFELNTCGHQFLLEMVPFRDPESHWALSRFVESVARSTLPAPLVDPVLLRCLWSLDHHTGGRMPMLVERFVAVSTFDGRDRFRTIVEDLLKFRGITDPMVARAVAEIDTRYAEADLEKVLAGKEGVTPRQLGDAFEKTTGLRTRAYIKSFRLSRAARMLVETHESKIWLKVGYGANSASNFDKDFRRQFGMTPGEYRRRALPTTLPPRLGNVVPATDAVVMSAADKCDRAVRVLIIEDDTTCAEMIASFLRSNGYTVAIALSATDGLREAAHRTPDVVLLDYRLGNGIDGIECLRALRRERRSRRPGVAIITAAVDVYDYSDEVRELRALLVPKPCGLEQYLAVVAYLSAPDFEFPVTERKAG